MALPMVLPVSCEAMVPVLLSQGLALLQGTNDIT